MKKILCLFPAYEIITNKNSGGKIILCKDILRTIQKKYDLYLFDWKNNLSDSIAKYDGENLSFKLINSKLFTGANDFQFILHFLLFFFNPLIKYSFFRPLNSAQLSLEYLRITNILNTNNYSVIYSAFTNSTFNLLVPSLKKKFSNIKFVSNFYHGKIQNHQYFDKVIVLMDGIVDKSVHKNFETIHPSVEVFDLKKTDLSRKKNEITFVSKLWKRKNCDVLINIFNCNEFKKFKLNIVGDGPEFKNLKELSKNNSRIIFHGDVDEESKFRIISRSRLFVVPSSDEGFGIVYIESLLVGTPIIGFHKTINYLKNFYKDYAFGESYDPLFENEDILKNKILRMLNMNFDYPQISKITSDYFSKNYFQKNYLDLFNEIV